MIFFPDERLRVKCREVREEEAETLYDDFRALFQAATNALGVAAPQVGLKRRLCLVKNVGEHDPALTQQMHALVNPVITERVGWRRSKEGCLSIPGVMVMVERAEQVTVEGWEYQMMDGAAVLERVRRTVSGLQAAIYQHEIDHLDGVLMTDRISEFRFRTAMSDYRKRNRKQGWFAKKDGAAFRQEAVDGD